MRRFGLLVVALTLVAARAAAGPREDALAVVEQWAAAFNSSDVAAILTLYADDATFLGTGSRSVVTARDDIRRYFERALLNDRPRAARLDEHEVQVLSDDAVLITGLDTTASTREGRVVETPGRITFVIARRGRDWRIVHFHRSSRPGG